MSEDRIAEKHIDQISEIVKSIISALGIESQVEAEIAVNGVVFNISSPDSNLLIGQKGNNLSALQLIVQNIISKQFGEIGRIILDVDDYRKKREWYLRETAKKALEHAHRTHRPVMLEPMPPYERRIIHAYLSENALFETESIGEGENRRIVIRPKDKNSI
jgi:spoIIIJ-associated protein